MTRPQLPEHDDLVAHALGLLPPRAAARVEAALAADPACRAAFEAVRAHLRRYDAFPAAPPPPPLERVLAALPAQARPRRWPRAAAAAALLLAGGAAALWAARAAPPSTGPAAREGAPPLALALTEAEVLTELRPEPRVRVVLDAGAALRHGPPGSVELARGRAWFEVGPGPYRVDTPRGPVEVLGTRFQVDLREDALRVAVAEGAVRVGGVEVPAGRAYEGPQAPLAPAALAADGPAWLRVPAVLRLEGPAAARPGERVLLRLVFENPTRAPLTLAGPAPVARSAYLALTPPQGEGRTQGLGLAEALGGALAPGRPLTLAAGERRSVTVAVDLPAEPLGAWRLEALYRPEGEPPLASLPLLLEIR